MFQNVHATGFKPIVNQFANFTPCALRYLQRGVHEIINDRTTDVLSCGNFRMAISPQQVVRSTSCLVPYGRVFGVDRSNGAISGLIKSNMAAGRNLGKFRISGMELSDPLIHEIESSLQEL